LAAWKGGCSQDWLPHQALKMSKLQTDQSLCHVPSLWPWGSLAVAALNRRQKDRLFEKNRQTTSLQAFELIG
jgi:hypothetical protein